MWYRTVLWFNCVVDGGGSWKFLFSQETLQSYIWLNWGFCIQCIITGFLDIKQCYTMITQCIYCMQRSLQKSCYTRKSAWKLRKLIRFLPPAPPAPQLPHPLFPNNRPKVETFISHRCSRENQCIAGQLSCSVETAKSFLFQSDCCCFSCRCCFSCYCCCCCC